MTTVHQSPLVEGLYLRNADDIDLMSGSNGELQELTNRLKGIWNGSQHREEEKKNRIITNSTDNIMQILA